LALAALVALFYFQDHRAARDDAEEPPAETMAARVTGVLDGDSLIVKTEAGREYTIRLYGLDAPEGRQAYGGKAAKFLAELVKGRDIVLKIMDKDSYGRLVALVYLEEDEPVNRRLITAGLAWVYAAHCRLPECALWREDEKTARQGREGLWRDQNPKPPWKYRQEMRD
jgi:endonuclease YncB( thermonuclease family)